MMIMLVVMAMVIKCSGLEKKKEKNKKLKAKVISIEADACTHNIKLYQMDVKSEFLNGYINELVYVEQPPGFEDDKKPDHVYKLKKALYVSTKDARQSSEGYPTKVD